MSSYRVTVTAGTHSWDTTAGDTADYGLADPVTITRSLPDVDIFPAQPNPAQATFSVIVPDALDLADVVESTEVAIHVYTPAAASSPTESFHGRVTDAQARPHPLGTVYTYTCVDYLADLVEETVNWEASYANDYAQLLIDDAFAQLGLAVGYVEGPPPFPLDPPFYSVSFEAPDPTTEPDGIDGAFLTMLERWLVQWVTVIDEEDPRGLCRFVLEQHVTDDALDPVTPYQLRPIFRSSQVDPTETPDPADLLVIDGDYVETGSTYSLNKRQGIRRIRVLRPNSSPDIASHPGTPKPTAVIDSDLTSGTHGAYVAAFYLPDDVPRARWVADTFTWRIDKDPSGDYLPQLGEPVSISPIVAAWNPLGYPWFTGRLTSYTLTVASGRHSLSFTLRDTAS